MDDAYIGELKAMRERGSISASTYQIELLIYWREKRKKRRRKEKRGERDVFSVGNSLEIFGIMLLPNTWSYSHPIGPILKS